MDEATLVQQQQDKALLADPQSIYADQMREEKVTNILQQINPDNLLAEIDQRLRGKKKNVFTHQWESISDDIKPVSELLIAKFVSYLGCVLNQNTSMSNFSASEINNLMELIIDWVKGDLVANAEVYEIEGQYTEYDRIGHIICTTCFTVFKRALNGQESKRIFNILRLHETTSQSTKGGFMDSLSFWK